LSTGWCSSPFLFFSLFRFLFWTVVELQPSLSSFSPAFDHCFRGVSRRWSVRSAGLFPTFPVFLSLVLISYVVILFSRTLNTDFPMRSSAPPRASPLTQFLRQFSALCSSSPPVCSRRNPLYRRNRYAPISKGGRTNGSAPSFDPSLVPLSSCFPSW